MAATRTGVLIEFESLDAPPNHYTRRRSDSYPKPGLSREALFSLLMCFPLTCMLWAAIIYGAFRLAR